MKRIPVLEWRFVEVEIPPGLYSMSRGFHKNEYSLAYTSNGQYLAQYDSPATVWEFQWRRNTADGMGKWSREGRIQPSWWTRLWNKPHRPAVPHAKVVTR